MTASAIEKRVKAERKICEQRFQEAIKYLDAAKSALAKASGILEADGGFRMATLEFLFLALRNVDNVKQEATIDAEHIGYTVP